MGKQLACPADGSAVATRGPGPRDRPHLGTSGLRGRLVRGAAEHARASGSTRGRSRRGARTGPRPWAPRSLVVGVSAGRLGTGRGGRRPSRLDPSPASPSQAGRPQATGGTSERVRNQ